MTRILHTWMPVAFGLIALSGIVAMAHHSAAMYEATKTVTLKGTVKQFRWVNPHVIVVLTTEAQEGLEVADWAVEMSSTGNMTRSGWNRKSVRDGERVEITARPMRDGSHGALCCTMKFLETGKSMDCSAREGIRAGETPNLPGR